MNNAAVVDGGAVSENVKRFDILRIDPQDKPIYLLVPAFGGEAGGEEYLYEEMRCPSNTMRLVEEIIYGGDTDPHGLIEYVRTTDEIAFPTGGYNPEEILQPHVPEAFTDPHP